MARSDRRSVGAWLKERLNWRVAVVRVVANGLAIALVVAVFPGVDAATDHPVLAALWVGLIYGVLNALVRPVLNLLLVPFVLQTYGLVMALVNILVFVLLGYVSRLIEIDSVWAAIGGGITLSILAWLLEGVLGLSKPVAGDATGEPST